MPRRGANIRYAKVPARRPAPEKPSEADLARGRVRRRIEDLQEAARLAREIGAPCEGLRDNDW